MLSGCILSLVLLLLLQCLLCSCCWALPLVLINTHGSKKKKQRIGSIYRTNVSGCEGNSVVCPWELRSLVLFPQWTKICDLGNTRNMYGRKACQLVKEFASAEKSQLSPYNSDLFEQVVGECSEHHLELQSLIRKIYEEGLDAQTARNADHFGALIHHLSLIRNKRCLMAYVYNRAETIRSLLWKIGHKLPTEFEEKLCHSENEYFKNFSKALKSYMSKAMVDLTVDMVPPKDPYIHVRVLEDIEEGFVLSDDNTATFARHSMHFLKRTDAEPFISKGLMEELTR